jgi:hypothetical protein
MFKSITANEITAVTAAALAATLTIFLTPGVVPEAKAHSQVTVMLPPLALADRVPAIAKVNACLPRGWPYYEQSCLFDLRTPADEVRTVRVIGLR